MFGTSGSLRFFVCTVVLVCVLSTCAVDGYFFDSITGLAADIMRKPLESFSLFALKSYLLGHLGGRVTQYRQMMYGAPNRHQQYAAMPSMPRSSGISSMNVHNRPRRSLIDDELYERVSANQKKALMADDASATATSVQFLEMAEKLDVDKCIPRLICEVMTGDGVTQAGNFEELVARVLGNEVPERKGDQNLFPSIYHYAAYVGKHATSGQACRELFPKCKASELEFRKMADKIFAGVDEAADDDDDVVEPEVEVVVPKEEQETEEEQDDTEQQQ